MNLKNTLFIAIACMVATQAQAFQFNRPNQRPVIFTNRYNQATALGVTGVTSAGFLYKAARLVRKNPLAAFGALYASNLAGRGMLEIEKYSAQPMFYENNDKWLTPYAQHSYNTALNKGTTNAPSINAYMDNNPHAVLDGWNLLRKQTWNKIKFATLDAANNGLNATAQRLEPVATYLMSPVTPEQEAAYKRAMF